MLKEIIKHFRTQAESRFNPSPDGSRERYYEGRKDAYNDCADVLERYLAKYPNGWHPGSELPTVEGEYIAIDNGMPGVFRVDYLEPFGWCVEVMGAHEVVNVKWWCYPPKED